MAEARQGSRGSGSVAVALLVALALAGCGSASANRLAVSRFDPSAANLTVSDFPNGWQARTYAASASSAFLSESKRALAICLGASSQQPQTGSSTRLFVNPRAAAAVISRVYYEESASIARSRLPLTDAGTAGREAACLTRDARSRLQAVLRSKGVGVRFLHVQPISIPPVGDASSGFRFVLGLTGTQLTTHFDVLYFRDRRLDGTIIVGGHNPPARQFEAGLARHILKHVYGARQ